MREYKEYLIKVVEFLGAPSQNPTYKDEIDAMIRMEKEFAQVFT